MSALWEPIEWIKLLYSSIPFEVLTRVVPTKGHLVYEYNPFRNYRLSKTMFEYKGEYYIAEELEEKFGITMDNPNNPQRWEKDAIDPETRQPTKIDVSSDVILHEKGELVDFITDELSFSINNPVSIIPLYSYDGSVNLILNDGVNIPRMINSRFSATGRNTYEVVDRKGDNDTNIYDLGEQFDIDTSLYKRITKIPKIEFKGVTSGGNLKVGNYHFYFKLSDADGNETDFVGETGLISVFIGFDDPRSIHTGQANENSYKSIQIKLYNLDSSYSYVYAYYSRYTAEGEEEFSKEYVKIDKKFLISHSGICSMLITGFEETINISAADINLNYNIVDSAVTLTACQNMLFLGNVHKADIPYRELEDLSLRFLPFLKQEDYKMDINELYSITTINKGYYDPKFIHDKTGYWGEEIYRFGIVYIMPNNELSPVFNIRGANNVFEFNNSPGLDNNGTRLRMCEYIEKNSNINKYGTYSTGTEEWQLLQELLKYLEQLEYNDGLFSEIPVYVQNDEGKLVRNYILYNESSYELLTTNDGIHDFSGITDIENIKGVVRFRPTKDTNTIYSLDIRVDDDTIQELKKYVKGYFFVRLTRIPTILALGITIGIDLNSYLPCVATADGYLNDLANQLEKTHVETEDINDVNYVSESFITRYLFKFEKDKSAIWKKIGIGVAIAAAVVVIAVASVFTCGAVAAVAAGVAVSISGAIAAGAAAVGAVAAAVGGAAMAAAIAGSVIVGTATTMATLGAIQEVRYALGRTFSKKTLKGRDTKCPTGYKIKETDDSRLLKNNYFERIIIKDPSKVKVQAILCPDYEVNLGYYNSIFTGNKHRIGLTSTLSINGQAGHSSNYFTNDERHYFIPSYYDMNIRNSYDFKIIGVPDDTTLTGIDDMKFRSRAGSAEEAWRYECVGDDYKSDYSKSHEVEDEKTLSNKQINGDIVRGSFGPYLAFNDKDGKFSPAETVNIYIPGYTMSNMDKYFQIRMLDTTPFMAISERIDLKTADDYLVKSLTALISENSRSCGYTFSAYRGDCYLCQFTHRMHRNFNDPSAPYNDEIVLEKSWKENYDVEETEKYEKINLGDVNAVLIGTWVTFRVRSSYNLNIRTLDGSDVIETAMTGHPKGYYPYNGLEVEGSYKHADSQIYNKGFSKSLSERLNMEVPDVPHIKNWFGTRIMYSDIHINDAYKNGYRVFKATAYRDYTREYGEIVKLLTLESDLICVFEHGVARIPVNKEQVAKQVSAGNNQITSFNVLPETPIILSDMFGSQWADSVLKTPGKTGNSKQYIYGVDTVAKKIWRTDGQTLECISDFKVQEFLNNNITLGERELTPILGIRNVKTFYNAFKRDVMFTFYDNTYGFEEKVWNLCWNELLNGGQGMFTTFYSWVPSFMENINNVPFSFDRNVSKWIAKLGVSHAENSFADGITLSNNVIHNYFLDGNSKKVVDNNNFQFTYITKSGLPKTITIDASRNSEIYEASGEQFVGFIGVLGLANRTLPQGELFYTISYELARDPWNNYKNFLIKLIGNVVMENLEDSKFFEKVEIQDNSSDQDALDQRLLFPIYGLFFAEEQSQNERALVYSNPATLDRYRVYTDPEHLHPVTVASAPIDPEVMMTELYYRNQAGHAYADYEINKIKFVVDNSHKKTLGGLEPTRLYNIEEVMDYVAENWYGRSDGRLPSEFDNGVEKPLIDYSRGESLLTRSGGPFEYDTIVYLPGAVQNGVLKYYACSGGLGHMIDNGKMHAPFSRHLLYGKFIEETVGKREEVEELPIFKDITGKRPMLPREEQLNPDKIVTLLNIRAKIGILDTENEKSLSDTYYNMKASYNRGTSLINAAQYESVVGITTKWNLQFLTSDFWKHGQAGIIDIADDIYPTYWYGKQHPFEFECIIVDDPSIHKIFTNLELIANKAKPESFHYEVVGETYDFAKDKVNMYFRQEALKALWQYNGADIVYDRNFLKVQPRQLPKSADFVHKYYTRLDTINDIEDYYISATYPKGYDYRHLSGGEIVYYPTRQEFRVWNHTKAVDLNDLSQDDSRSIIAANCQYLEDRWKVTINPLIVCYKNEYNKTIDDGLPLIAPAHSTWAKAYGSNQLLPSLPIYNSPIPDKVKLAGQIAFPGTAVDNNGNISETELDKQNALYQLYDLTEFGKTSYAPLDTTNWLNDVDIYRYNFGEAHNRKETDIRDKFVKIRIRYSGEELAIIDFLNTIYLVSYS